jgi:hypothetical protein
LAWLFEPQNGLTDLEQGSGGHLLDIEASDREVLAGSAGVQRKALLHELLQDFVVEQAHRAVRADVLGVVAPVSDYAGASDY